MNRRGYLRAYYAPPAAPPPTPAQELMSLLPALLIGGATLWLLWKGKF